MPNDIESENGLHGFNLSNPPFRATKTVKPAFYPRKSLIRCVEIISSFIESDDDCWSRDFGLEHDARSDAVRNAMRARELLLAVAPDCVSVARRGTALFLVRR